MEPSGFHRGEWIWVIAAAASVIALASLPYVTVALTTPSDLRFAGVLINPFDGNSYLAKMQIGAQGGWLFHLLYTSHDHPGALLFSFHILIGHIAAWTRLPIALMYHLARAAAGFMLLLVIYALAARVTPDLAERRATFLFVALSSGLGWLAAAAGHQGTSDLFIPESNTFFSLHVNPHFPLATALMVGMIMQVVDWRPASHGLEVRGRKPVGGVMALALMSLALALVQPFAVVTVYSAFGVYFILRWRRDGCAAWPLAWQLVIAGLATLPLVFYTFWITQAEPVLRGWTVQNLTPSPPVWDYLLGYGLILILAVPGVVAAARRRSDMDLMLLAWSGVTAFWLYAPFALQRRFSLGLHVPLAILAAMGVWRVILPRLAEKRRRLAASLLWGAALPTTAFVIVLALGIGLGRDPRLFVSADEAAAMDWLRDHAPRDAVVLASPEMGLFIPAWSGRRVVYGHPFETLDAEQTRARVVAFFAAATDQTRRQTMLRDWRATFVFVGPRERALGLAAPPPGREVFRNAAVTIYEYPCSSSNLSPESYRQTQLFRSVRYRCAPCGATNII